jgi:outer membrane protein OmpA-like peptidoglycan-associated protein
MKNVSNDLKYKLNVKDSKDNISSTNEKTIQFKVTTIKQKKKEKKGDKEIDRYSLILFDFDKADLEKNNLKIINDIKQKIKPTSDIYITGHTDRTGEDSYNLRLSIERAFATKKAMGFPKAIAEGVGEKIILHDNDLPEGRFFCRTVNIIVETKLK